MTFCRKSRESSTSIVLSVTLHTEISFQYGLLENIEVAYCFVLAKGQQQQHNHVKKDHKFYFLLLHIICIYLPFRCSSTLWTTKLPVKEARDVHKTENFLLHKALMKNVNCNLSDTNISYKNCFSMMSIPYHLISLQEFLLQ